MRTGSGANTGNLVELWKTGRGAALADGGIKAALRALGLRSTNPRLATSIREVFHLKETKDERPVLTDTSFGLAVEELDDGEAEDRVEWFAMP